MGLLLSAQRLVWVVVWEILFEDGVEPLVAEPLPRLSSRGRGLQVIPYRATLDVPRALAQYVDGLLGLSGAATYVDSQGPMSSLSVPIPPASARYVGPEIPT